MDKNDVNEVSKSIQVGTVDFFGVMIPGMIIIVMCIVGFFTPLVMVLVDLSNTQMTLSTMDTNIMLVSIFLLVIFSYMFGYILRLSSPDKLDRKSAIKVIRGEYDKSSQEISPLTIRDWFDSIKNPWQAFKKWGNSIKVSIKASRNDIQGWINKDKWPFDPSNPMDKYPYLNFREYLKKRGHEQLAEELATWDVATDKKQRSKSAVNKMKISIRLYCPELSTLIDSEEAHIRLMSGTWSAFKFSQWPIWIALIVISVAGFAPQWIKSILSIQPLGHYYFVYIFININLLLIIFFCNQQIEKLFHYRRVSELFHIVQAAHFANEQKRQRDTMEQVALKRKQKK